MKKKYITPSMQACQMALCQIVAASAPNIGIDKNGSVEAADVEVKAGNDNFWGESVFE